MSAQQKKLSFLVLFFVPLLLGGVLYLSWNTIRLQVFSWVLKSYSEHFLGYQLTFDRAYLDEKNHLWIEHPQLKIAESSAPFFEAEQAEAVLLFRLWERALFLKIQANSPHLYINKEPLKGLATPFTTRLPLLLRAKFQLTIPQGSLWLSEEKQEPNAVFSFAFSNTHQPAAALQLHSYQHPDQQLNIHWSSSHSTHAIQLHASAFPLQAAFFHRWFPLEDMKGSLDGHLTFEWKKGNIQKAQGALHLEHLEIASAPFGQIRCPKLSLIYPEGAEEGHLPPFEMTFSPSSAPSQTFSGTGCLQPHELIWHLEKKASHHPRIDGRLTPLFQQEQTLHLDVENLTAEEWEGIAPCLPVDLHIHRGVYSGRFKCLLDRIICEEFRASHGEWGFFKGKGNISFESLRGCGEILVNQGLLQKSLNMDLSGQGMEGTCFGISFKKGEGALCVREGGISPPSTFRAEWEERKTAFCLEAEAPERFHLAFHPLSSSEGVNGTLACEAKTEGRILSLMGETTDFSLETARYYLCTKEAAAASAAHFEYRLSLDTLHSDFQVRASHLLCVDKPTNIRFYNMQGSYIQNGTYTGIQGLQAFADGLYVAGDVEFCPDSTKTCWHLKLDRFLINGWFSNAQKILRDFHVSSCFSYMPLEGHFQMTQGDSQWSCFLTPENLQLLGVAKGSLTEGKISSEKLSLEVSDVECEFEYDGEKKQLQILDLQGILISSSPDHIDEYPLQMEQLVFSDFEKHQGTFALSINDKEGEWAFLSGSSKILPDPSPSHQPLIEICLDPHRSYFGALRPAHLSFLFDDWTTFHSIHFQADTELQSSLKDLKKIARTGCLGLSQGFLKALETLHHAKGNLHLNIFEQMPEKRLRVTIEGKQLALEEREAGVLSIQAFREGEEWHLEQFQWDDLTMAADFEVEGDHFRIPFMGIRYKDALKMGVEGVYFPSDNHLQGMISLLEMKLDQLSQFPSFASFGEAYPLQGNLRAHGNLDVKVLQGRHGWRGEVHLKGDLHRLKFEGFPCGDMQDVQLHFSPDAGFSFENVRVSSPYGALKISQGGYEFSEKSLWMTGASFKIGGSNGIHVERYIGAGFPSFLKQCTCKEGWQGTFSFQHSPSASKGHLFLEEGLYRYGDAEGLLKETQMVWKDHEWTISTQLAVSNHWLAIKGSSPNKEFSSGTVSIHAMEAHPHKKPLVIQWASLPDQEIVIESVKGELLGARVDLEKSPSESQKKLWVLEGKMEYQTSLEEIMGPFLFLGDVQGDWALEGRWKIPKFQWDQKEFEGRFKGEHLRIGFCSLEKMEGDLSLKPQEAVLSHIETENPKEKIHLHQMTFQQKGNRWKMKIPHITFENVSPFGKESEFHPFLVKTCTLREVSAEQPFMETLQAKGSLHFTNPLRKRYQDLQLWLPADFIQRLGLELPVLIPVTGTMDFELKNRQCLFTHFKEMYSENKMMRFSLSKSSLSSVDFDGRLNLHIALQPHNVLFKLKDLLTIHVSGEVRRPLFSRDEG